MDDEEPETVARLVTYLHTNDYGYETRPAPGRPAPPPQSTQRSLLATADLYALAARYEMAGLAALATSKFDSLRQGYWPFDDFAELLDAVYLKTPASYLGLRDLLADSVCSFDRVDPRPLPLSQKKPPFHPENLSANPSPTYPQCALHPREILAAPLRTALARHGDLAGAVLQIVNRRYADAAVTGLMAHKETAVALLDARNSLAAVREELAEAREELEEVREERDWAVRVIHGPVGIVPPAA